MKRGEWWSVKFNLAQSEVSFFEAVSDPINTGLIFNISPCSWKWYQPEETSQGFPNSQRGKKGVLAAPHQPDSFPTNRLAWSWTLTQNLSMNPGIQGICNELNADCPWGEQAQDGKGILVLMWRKGYEHCLGFWILLRNRIKHKQEMPPISPGNSSLGRGVRPSFPLLTVQTFSGDTLQLLWGDGGPMTALGHQGQCNRPEQLQEPPPQFSLLQQQPGESFSS